jgi:hypothetical protein
LASLFIGHAAQKSKLHNLQYDEGGNHMAETETSGTFQNRLPNICNFVSFEIVNGCTKDH